MQEHLLSAADTNETSFRSWSIRKIALATTGAYSCSFLVGLLFLACIALSPWQSASPELGEVIPVPVAESDLGNVKVWPSNHADLDETTLAQALSGRPPVARSVFPPSPSKFLNPRSGFPVSHSPFRSQRPLQISHAQGDLGSAVMSPPSESLHAESSIESTKASLLRVALLGGRGVWSRPTERDRAAVLIEELERSSKGTPKLRDGVWELAVSDLEPFRASVFFLALAEAVEARIMAGASDGALTVHSLATGGGEVGRVAHVVEGNASRLHSLVELKTGSVPSIPFALTGTVVSSGELSTTEDSNDAMFSLVLKNTSVQGNKVRYGLPSGNGLQPGEEPNLLSWIGDQFVPSGDIFSSVLDPIGGGQTALLHLTYSDDEMMVWRMPRLGNHFFCFVRGEPESWPAMDELRSREGTKQQSAVGSAFALGMLNAFWTRRAGLRD